MVARTRVSRGGGGRQRQRGRGGGGDNRWAGGRCLGPGRQGGAAWEWTGEGLVRERERLIPCRWLDRTVGWGSGRPEAAHVWCAGRAGPTCLRASRPGVVIAGGQPAVHTCCAGSVGLRRLVACVWNGNGFVVGKEKWCWGFRWSDCCGQEIDGVDAGWFPHTPTRACFFS